MTFSATKAKVSDQGAPPDEFLEEQVTWGQAQDDLLFEENSNADIYSLIEPTLGPWTGILHRRAAMLEAMRVHAAFESSWRWTDGKDPKNRNPDPSSWETGAFQVSFDSTAKSPSLIAFCRAQGAGTLGSFIPAMKSDHGLALSYYARLVRVDITWAGPLVRREILPWLSRESVAEFQSLLIAQSGTPVA